MEDMVAKAQIRLPRKWRIDASLYCSVAVCWKVFVGVMILYDLDQTSCHFTNFLMTFWLRYTFHCWISVTHRIQIPRPCSEKNSMQGHGPWLVKLQSCCGAAGSFLSDGGTGQSPGIWASKYLVKSYSSHKSRALYLLESLIRAFWSILIFGLWGAQISNKSPTK